MSELQLERQIEPGRLRVYLGAAPGVGKTYHMLADAHMARSLGKDIVIGLIEPHQRKETAEQIRDLETIPERVIPYKAVNLKEMDLDAILARKPEIVLVDELAHTNVPGCREVVRDGVEGLLVPPNDWGGLIQAMAKLAQSPELRADMGAAARRHVEDMFSIGKTVDLTLDLYQTMLASDP